MNNPTVVDELVVVGQRRRSSDENFPSLPIATPNLPPDYAVIDPDDTGGGFAEPQISPCDAPETRIEWNADAAAAQALKMMRDYALDNFGESDFANREYGAVLCQNSDGSISVGPILDGNPIFNSDGTYNEGHPSVPIGEAEYGVCSGESLPIGSIQATHTQTQVYFRRRTRFTLITLII